MRLPIHRWYRYSAGFSAEWVKTVLQKRDLASLKVLDPFGGSATTLLAADEIGASSIGVEAHPFVTRIAQAKLLWDSPIASFDEFLSSVTTKAVGYSKQFNIQLSEAPALLQKTYSEDAFYKLEALRLSWEEMADKSPASELAWLAITTIVRACSYAGTAPWQYVLPNKRKSKVIDPFDAIRSQKKMMREDMAYLQTMSQQSVARMLLGDARNLHVLENNSVNLVITSPPYPNNYDYADATRLEMTFWREIDSWGDLQQAARQYLVRSCTQHVSAERLQLDQLLLDPNLTPIIDELEPICRELEEERFLHGGKKQYHLMVAAYFTDMAKVWHELYRVSMDGADLCFVIGDSAPYGIYLPAARWHGELARSAGFNSVSFHKTRDRNVKWKNRTHTVLLSEGELWVSKRNNIIGGSISMSRVGSATHKLGQMVGNFFESYFEESLRAIAEQHNLYCDCKGLRSALRGNRTKVTWQDKNGTPHDLDYVFERGGSFSIQGSPIAFIELAWRRYTKHSRNKAGEIEGALLHLGETFPEAFLGAILAGEWSQGSLQQLNVHGVKVLYIPFEEIAQTFDAKGINLRYDEKSTDAIKWEIIETWEQLSTTDMGDLQREFGRRISEQYRGFLAQLEKMLARHVLSVRVLHLYGEEVVYNSIEAAISELEQKHSMVVERLSFVKYEVQIRYSNGDRIEGIFNESGDTIEFLKRHLYRTTPE